MTRTMTAEALHHSDDTSTGGRLVATDGRPLPLLAAHVRAEARGGIARTVLTQTFRNVHAEPLQVTYLLPLPHEGAVSGFAFRLDGRRVVGEVDKLDRARARFEEAVLEGRTAALLEQERGSLFTQQLGNVPPGATVEAEITVDQRLAWRPDEGGWEWRFPTVVAPRYQGAPGRVDDASRTSVPIAEGAIAPRVGFELTVRGSAGRPSSPSHPVTFREEAGLLRAAPAEGPGFALDRDLVVRWRAAAPEVALSLEAFRSPASKPGRLEGRAFGLLTVIPPGIEARPRPVPRDLIVLIDASGSMGGEPLDQARRVVGALVDSLGDEDQLELIAFADAPTRWKRGPVAATAASKREALRWLGELQASGGTEMREGIRAALRGVREDAQRQVVLITDGLIGFEQEVVAEIRAQLPDGSRVHTVGVGSGVNRSLTGPAARAGRGREVVIGLGEDPERAAAVLRAHTAAPLVTSLSISGSAVRAHAPARLADLYAGAPALVGLELAPEGGTLVVEGQTAEGAFARRLTVPPVAHGGEAAIAALFGREAVEDLEAARAAGDDQERLDRAVEKLGLEFQLSTRLTSWVAVSEEPTVDPTKPTRREEMPHMLPHGMSAEGLGLRSAAGPFPAGAVMPVMAVPMTASMAAPPPAPFRSAAPRAQASFDGSPKMKKAEVHRGPPAQLDEAMEELAPEPKGGARGLRARITKVGDRLVVEAEVDGADLDWTPPEEVQVALPGFVVRTLRVDHRATTGAGTFVAGTTLRLVLEGGGDLAAEDVHEVELDLGGAPFVLVLSVGQ
jgi:Ca-activated chloride channel family protein